MAEFSYVMVINLLEIDWNMVFDRWEIELFNSIWSIYFVKKFITQRSRFLNFVYEISNPNNLWMLKYSNEL